MVTPFDRVREINSIIMKDATDTTYKYALLRGVAEICQEYVHFSKLEDGKVYLPTGLLLEKWLLYYYPLIASAKFIPQKGDEGQDEGLKISFRKQFNIITDFYRDKGGFSVFYRDYKVGNIPTDVQEPLRQLVSQILYTITRYPMKHLGYSQYHKHYSIFNFEKGTRIDKTRISPESLIKNCGRFSLDKEMFEVFRDFGSYISGENTVLNKWAEFSMKASRDGDVKQEKVLEILREYPITERDTADASKVYRQLMHDQGYLESVWSGRKIWDPNHLHIDHVIPFTIWKNNDLWNLMPSNANENMLKRDRIPSQALLLKRKNTIYAYWKVLADELPTRFASEIKISLTGGILTYSYQFEEAFKKLEEKTRFLIENRGYPEWNL